MLNKLHSKILASIKNKRINVFLIFLLLAFTILIFTKLSKTYTNTIAFKIVKINVPEDKVILKNSDSTLNITLKTHGFKWLDFYFSNPKIKIDFSKDVALKNSTFIWTKSKTKLFNSNQFTRKVDVINMFPDTLYFNYDVNMVKNIPVKLNAEIKFNPGFDVFDDYKTFPDSVKVIGPKEILKSINNIETEPINLTDIKSNVNELIALKLPKKEKDLKFSNTSVNLKANVERFTEGTINVPITLLNVPEGIKLKYFPKEVTVTFYTSLNNYKAVKPNAFKVICDFSKVANEQSFFIPELVKQSELAKSVKISKQHIEFIILK